jgi:GT2 family glycosyltransferase
MLLVDNGSTDDSVAYIREHYPEVIILENRENLGFSGGNNVGMRYALEQGAEYILLLNNDTEVAPDFLDELIKVASSASDIGIVGPKMYYYDQPQTIWCAGNNNASYT